MSSIVELEDVSRSFPGSPPVEAVRNASLSVAEGDYVTIVGPSGSGKSTLLHILGCLDTPTGGKYRLLGLDTGSLGDGLRTSLRGSEIGFVFQAFHLLPYRSVLENVMTGLVYNRTPRRERKQLASEALIASTSLRASYLEGKDNGWRSPVRLPVAPVCCCVTNPPGTWTQRPRSRSWICSMSFAPTV